MIYYISPQFLDPYIAQNQRVSDLVQKNVFCKEFPENMVLPVRRDYDDIPKVWLNLYDYSCIIDEYQLVVSGEMKKIMEKFMLPEHRFYPVMLHDLVGENNREKRYYLFHIIEDWLDQINFEETTFYNKDTEKIISEKIRNKHEFWDLNEQCYINYKQTIEPLKIKFKNELTYDLFHLGGFVVSEALKKRILDSGIQGIEFQVVPNLVIL